MKLSLSSNLRYTHSVYVQRLSSFTGREDKGRRHIWSLSDIVKRDYHFFSQIEMIGFESSHEKYRILGKKWFSGVIWTAYIAFWFSSIFADLSSSPVAIDTTRSNMHRSFIYCSEMTAKIDLMRHLWNGFKFIYWISSSFVRVTLWILILDGRPSRYVALSSFVRTYVEY